MNTLNFQKIDINIENLKYPITFICRLISYKDELDDETISIILRLFFKHHFETLIFDNIVLLLNHEFDDFFITNNLIHEFYDLVNNKILLINVLNKWYHEYTNPEFWNLELTKQIEYLKNKKDHFYAIFECSKGMSTPFYFKLLPIMNNSIYRVEILDEIVSRLLILLSIIPKNIFILLKIPLILVSKFYEMQNEEVIKYLHIIYNQINLLINSTIDIFTGFQIVCDRMDKILNPLLVDIISDDILSETEIEDIDLFCE
jgi:hypothetical protein